MTSGFELATDSDGKRALFDAGGIRQATETAPDVWEFAIGGGNWFGVTEFARGILATPDPGRQVT